MSDLKRNKRMTNLRTSLKATKCMKVDKRAKKACLKAWRKNRKNLKIFRVSQIRAQSLSAFFSSELRTTTISARK